MATSRCIIMHDAAADARARQRHMSPSHMHRAGYRHAASASVYTLSLVSMSQYRYTTQLLIICLPKHAKGCRYQSYECKQVGVCTNTRIHTQIHKYTLPYTLLLYLHKRTSTHPHPIIPMCVHIGVYQSTHALTRFLSHTHPQAHCLPSCPSSYLISPLCCLRVLLQQRYHHLQPCSVDYCPMQGQPTILLKSRQQAMSAHYTRSQPARRPKGRVLLPAAPL